MSARYEVFVCDLRQRSDHLVDHRVNKAASLKLVREKNAAVLAEHPGESPFTLPLYYCCRVDHCNSPEEDSDE